MQPLCPRAVRLGPAGNHYESTTMFKQTGTLTALGLALALAACGGNGGGGGDSGGSGGSGGSSGNGGGGGGPGNIASAEGAWTGTNSLGNNFDLLVLENGDLYSMYGTLSGGIFSAAGFDTAGGTASVSGSTLTASITQYDFAGHRVTGTLSANVVTGTSINGSASATGGGPPTTFTSTPLTATYGSYNYNTAATVSVISGAWIGNLLDGSAAFLSIDSAGILSGTNLGCSFTGTVTPRPSGKNVFNMSIHFGGSPCSAANQNASGIAISYIATNGKRQLIAAAENSAKTQGSMFFAQR